VKYVILISSSSRPTKLPPVAMTVHHSCKSQQPLSQRPLTHYQILQVSVNASASAIKDAYHAAARIYHPDKQKQRQPQDSPASALLTSAPQKFLAIQKAWECLRDTERRRLYDQSLALQATKVQRHRLNAALVHPDDCRKVVIHSDSCSPSVDSFSLELVFQCQCGHDVHPSQLPDISDDDECQDLVQCPGCSLVYNVSLLYNDVMDDEDGKEADG
jgi:curved DNA-binding protein CbpA